MVESIVTAPAGISLSTEIIRIINKLVDADYKPQLRKYQDLEMDSPPTKCLQHMTMVTDTLIVIIYHKLTYIDNISFISVP